MAIYNGSIYATFLLGYFCYIFLLRRSAVCVSEKSFGFLGDYEGLGNVFDQVLKGFNAEGKTDKVVGDAEDGSSLSGD